MRGAKGHQNCLVVKSEVRIFIGFQTKTNNTARQIRGSPAIALGSLHEIAIFGLLIGLIGCFPRTALRCIHPPKPV